MLLGHRRIWFALAVSIAATSPTFAQQSAPANNGGLRFPGLPTQRPPQRQAALPQPQQARVPRPQPQPRVQQQPRVPDGFQLSPADQAKLAEVLEKWEKNNKKIKTFSCKFKLTEYRAQLLFNGQGPAAPASHDGELKYAAPDQGMYKVEPDDKGQGGEHWICDGKVVYEVRAEKKQIIERPLPKELQGKAIADAPLPFVFSSSAQKMQQRFWMRVSTPDRNFTNILLQPGQILLEAQPKTPHDAANFRMVQIILNEADMSPCAINEFLPNHTDKNEQRLVYVFDPPTINGAFEAIKNFFTDPKKKWGYKVIRDEPPSAQEQPQRPLVPSANSKNRPTKPLMLR